MDFRALEIANERRSLLSHLLWTHPQQRRQCPRNRYTGEHGKECIDFFPVFCFLCGQGVASFPFVQTRSSTCWFSNKFNGPFNNCHACLLSNWQFVFPSISYLISLVYMARIHNHIANYKSAPLLYFAKELVYQTVWDQVRANQCEPSITGHTAFTVLCRPYFRSMNMQKWQVLM